MSIFEESSELIVNYNPKSKRFLMEIHSQEPLIDDRDESSSSVIRGDIVDMLKEKRKY